MQMHARWEDDENNRVVHLRIETQVDGSATTITPVRVDFTDQDRSVGIHTAAGQALLRSQLEASGKLDDIVNTACDTVA